MERAFTEGKGFSLVHWWLSLFLRCPFSLSRMLPACRSGMAGRLPKSHFQLTSFHSFFPSCLFAFHGHAGRPARTMTAFLPLLSSYCSLVLNNNASLLFFETVSHSITCSLCTVHKNVGSWILLPSSIPFSCPPRIFGVRCACSMFIQQKKAAWRACG